MKDYIKELTKCLTLGVSMKTTLEGKASENGADKALIIKSLGVFIMFSCFGIAAIFFALSFK